MRSIYGNHEQLFWKYVFQNVRIAASRKPSDLCGKNAISQYLTLCTQMLGKGNPAPGKGKCPAAIF